MYYDLCHQSTEFVELVWEDEPYEEFSERQTLLTETRSVLERWRHPTVAFNKYDSLGRRISRKTSPAAFESDAPGHTLGLALSAKAANALRDLWDEYGELLPVPSNDGEFYIFHCMNEIDAIDNINCVFSGGTIKRYAMKADVVRGQHIFRVSQPYKYSTIFASQLVIDRINEAKLKGFRFDPVWSEEAGGVPQTPVTHRLAMIEYGRGCRAMGKRTWKKMIDEPAATAKQLWAIDLNADAADVLEHIRATGVSVRDSGAGFTELVAVGMTLGTLWGELVRRDFGWEWAVVKREHGESVGLVSPTRSHAILPHGWLTRCLCDSGSGPSVSELYEIIRSERLPEAGAGAYLIVV